MSMFRGHKIPIVSAVDAEDGSVENVLLDVREADEWEAGHAARAQWIPLGELESARFTLPMNRRIVCVCRSGVRSARATESLIAWGFDAANMEGGMKAWAALSFAGLTFDRSTALRRLADEHFDVLVIGGGITGAGVALDAATRGLRTALVERHDIASGTSSKSSKLVHGGIRYLQQREIGLVYEALAERQVLRNTAPHLVRVLPFLLPVFTRDGILPRRLARILGATMWAYDLTGGLRIGKVHKRVSKEEALQYMPTLHADNVAASYVYYDAQTDDARLTLAVARTAADYGAAVANYASLVGLDKDASGR